MPVFLLKAPVTAFLALSIALASPALAQSAQEAFEAGTAAYKAGDYRKAAELWEPLAEDGEAEAMENLAQLYRLGLGVDKDNARAYKLYSAAADAGSAEAQVNAAFLLLTGQGVEKNPAEAALLFAKAADQGDALAQFNLGLMYEKGVGVERDTELARELYQLAANQGQERALVRLDAMEAALPPDGGESARREREADAESETESAAADNGGSDARTTDNDRKDAELTERSARPAAEEDAPDPEDAPDSEGARADAADDADADAPSRIEIRKPGQTSKEAGRVLSIRRAEAESGADPDLAPVEPRRRPERPDAEDTETQAATWPESREPLRGPQRMARTDADAGPEAAPRPRQAFRLPESNAERIAMARAAERAYRGGEFDRAAAMLTPLSEAGLPSAQFWLGRMYNRGEGVALDRYEAYSLWRSAAEHGSSRAATALANLAARLTPQEMRRAEIHHLETRGGL